MRALMLRLLPLAALAALVAVGIAACGDDPTPTPRPAATATPTSAGPEPTPTPRPTPTPGELQTRPTPTPVPTSTPTPATTIKRGGVLQGYNCCDINLDPHRQALNSYVSEIYSQLLHNPRGTDIECDLCTSWSVENEGRTLRFNLRDGVLFHDGSVLTSADVKYSLAKIQGLVDGIPSRAIGYLRDYVDDTKGDATYSQDGESKDGVTTPDAHTVELHLKQPSAFVPQLLVLGAAVIIKENTTTEEASTNPIGSGPFQLKELQPSSFIELERNLNYYEIGDDGLPLPYMDGLKTFVIKDENVALSQFLTGRVDFMRTLNPIPPSFEPQIDELVANGEASRQRYAPPQSPVGLFFNVSKPPFDDLRLRQAVNLVIDREAYNQALWNGNSFPGLPMAFTIFGRPDDEVWNVLPGWGTGEKKAEEVEQAKALMVEAGYGDGIKDVNMLTVNFSGTINMGEFFAAELAKLGIEATLDIQDFAVWNPRTESGDFHLTPMWWTLFTADPDESLANQYITGAVRNTMHYSSAEIDRLFQEQSVELDPEKRLQLVRQIEDILLEDLPVADAMSPQANFIQHSYVRGWEFGIAAGAGARNRERMWLDR